MQTATQTTKYQEVLSIAGDLYRQDPDWVTFFREVLGIDGIIRRAFPDKDILTEFEASSEYEDIQRFLKKLREKKLPNDADTEPTRVITVRLPKSMHEYLRIEAHEKNTSMNKLCISKLLQMIDGQKVPKEPPPSPRSRRRRTTNEHHETSPFSLIENRNSEPA